jgi:hypothetical protein
VGRPAVRRFYESIWTWLGMPLVWLSRLGRGLPHLQGRWSTSTRALGDVPHRAGNGRAGRLLVVRSRLRRWHPRPAARANQISERPQAGGPTQGRSRLRYQVPMEIASRP